MSMSSTVSDTVPRADAAPLSATQPFLWSVRRELWENRSLYIAPAAIGALMLFGFAVSLFSLAKHADEIKKALTPDSAEALAVLPYDIATAAVVVGSVIVGFFYCVNALYSERRERSILFWKSLPVSNLTTVLSKMSMPVAVLPAVIFAVVVVMHLGMMALNIIACLAVGLSVPDLLSRVPLLQMEVVFLYGAIVLALWLAPIYAYLIMVSAWAKKAPILWAVLPPLALMVFEKIASDTHYVSSLLGYRLGWPQQAFFEPRLLPLKPVEGHTAHIAVHGSVNGHHAQMSGIPVFEISQINVVGFLSTPDLWLGFAVAAAFLAVSVWLRRTREAI